MSEEENPQTPIIKGVKFGYHPEVRDKVEKRVQERANRLRGSVNMTDLVQDARDEVARDIMLERARKKNRDAEKDTVTGLLNRKGFDRTLVEEAARARRLNQPLSIIYMDLNRLKITNDTLGHEAGDALIRKAASVLAQGRSLDRSARWGGDEFAQLLPGTTQEEAVRYWQRLDRSFKEAGVSISAGITQIDPSTLETVSESVRLCDLAMLKAKEISKTSGNNEMITTSDLTEADIRKVA